MVLKKLFNISSNVVGDSNDQNNFPIKLFLNHTKTTKIY